MYYPNKTLNVRPLSFSIRLVVVHLWTGGDPDFCSFCYRLLSQSQVFWTQVVRVLQVSTQGYSGELKNGPLLDARDGNNHI